MSLTDILLLLILLVLLFGAVDDADARVNRWKAVAPLNQKLDRMATCESGQRWGLNTGNGFYGGLQFLPSTWRGVGGRGMPHHHSELEQKYRAVLLIRRAGFRPWPVCGRR